MYPCTYRDFDLWLIEQARNLPCLMNKESNQQKQAQAQQNQFNQQLQQIYQQQFSEQQDILKVLTPQLEAMASKPEGFGATEYAALQAGIVNTTGQQFQNVASEQAREFATSNEAGLPSGVQAQVQADLKGAAAGQVASQSSSLAIANEQLKQQQRDFALSSLAGLNAQTGSQMENTGSQAGAGLQNAFANATTVYNQGTWWKNVLSGVAGAFLPWMSGKIFPTSGANTAPSGGGGSPIEL